MFIKIIAIDDSTCSRISVLPVLFVPSYAGKVFDYPTHDIMTTRKKDIAVAMNSEEWMKSTFYYICFPILSFHDAWCWWTSFRSYVCINFRALGREGLPVCHTIQVANFFPPCHFRYRGGKTGSGIQWRSNRWQVELHICIKSLCSF